MQRDSTFLVLHAQRHEIRALIHLEASYGLIARERVITKDNDGRENEVWGEEYSLRRVCDLLKAANI